MKRNKSQTGQGRGKGTGKVKFDEKPQIEEQTGKKIAEQQDQQMDLFDDTTETK